jgi:hypothetical protein
MSMWQVLANRPSVSPGVACLVTLCVADAFLSAWLFQSNLAVEANPLLRSSAEAGVFQFLGAKGLTFVPGAVFLDWYHRREPRRAGRLAWTACAAYALLYLGGAAAQWVGAG